MVFVGFGVEAPARGEYKAANAYEGVDVKGKWVMFFRGLPANIKPEQRLRLSYYADLRYKAASAKGRGALGIIVAPAPGIEYNDELIKLNLDAAGSGRTIASLSIDRSLFDRLTKPFGAGFARVVKALDAGDRMRAVEIPGVKISARLDIKRKSRTGRNVIGVLKANVAAGEAALPPLVIGAHVDHLGRGEVSSSLAREDEKGQIHYGADDNASGVAALLEIAEGMAGLQKRGHLKLERDIIFAAWSGEELGLLGSRHFLKKAAKVGAGAKRQEPLFAAYLNMDMVGRLRDRLMLFGAGSSTVWRHIIERANVMAGLRLKLVDDSYVPTDATSFYLKGVPVLHAFTGTHEQYHNPRDTPSRLNYKGLAKIATLIDGVAKQIAASRRAPDFIKQTAPRHRGARRRASIYLGTIPDYAASKARGVKLSGVVKGGPAEKAGLQGGDILLRLADTPLENIYDYVRVLNMLKAGAPVTVQLQRNGKPLSLTLTPAPRE